MKQLKHVWRYLTSPMYRAYVDLQMSQQALDAHMNLLKDNMQRANLPPLLMKYMDAKGISEPHTAEKLFRAEYGIKSY